MKKTPFTVWLNTQLAADSAFHLKVEKTLGAYYPSCN